MQKPSKYNMFLAILTTLTALTISAVAIYYSIAGLVAIFAAAAIPIIIMGGALEVGKLVTAVWLHKHWKRATWWLKSYLTIAVVVLMFITSMGIFGFLSKAHIEQTSASVENIAQVEQIDKQIAQLNAVITRAEQTIKKTETSGTGADQNIQAQIDKEQERINTAYDRVKPAIDETNAQLKEDTKLYTDQIAAVDVELEKLASMSSIDTSDRDAVKLLQQLVGARPDGRYGSGTARAVKEFKEGLETKKQNLFAQIEELKNTAKEEVKRLRARAETEIDDSNRLIERLRKQLGTDTGVDIDAIIDEQNTRIKTANAELDVLTEQKFTIESEYRKLEAEVGPIKYIAEFIYGEAADKTMLEEAVRWVILIIIFVFDPLAVLLLIASQYTFEWARKKDDDFDFASYERKRAEKIAANPGPDPEPEEPTEEETSEEEKTTHEMLMEGFEEEQKQRALEEEAEDVQQVASDYVEKKDTESSEESKKNDLEAWNDWVEAANKAAEDEKTEDSSMMFGEDNIKKNEIKDRANKLAEMEEDAELSEAKRLWKAEHPDQNIKDWKQAYVTGRIHKLPWEDLKDQLRAKPDLTEVIEPEGYKQNEEQSEQSIWNRIKRDSE